MKFLRLVLSAVLFSAVVQRPCRAGDLSLDDLGFQNDTVRSDQSKQETLHKRSRMLKTHQIMGLITAIPMTATVMSGPGDDPKNGSKARFHRALGTTTGAMYFTTASFSIFAPEVDDKKSTGATKIHKALAFIHFPAMVVAPILGYQAYKQRGRGEEVHGAAKHHSTVAGVGYAAYMTSMLVMVFNF